MLASLLPGFLTGLSLIVAIGAQNVFVLRQGLVRRHVVPVVLVCMLSDLVLIFAGVAGVGALVSRVPAVLVVARVAGALFLTGYAVLAVRRAVRGEHLSDPSTGSGRVDGGGRGLAVVTALALTWLNPHVYLDTLLLLGSIAGTYGADGRWGFGVGAGLASILWFFGLGHGAQFLVPLFRRATAWRVLDIAIAVIMIGIAVMLVVGS